MKLYKRYNRLAFLRHVPRKLHSHLQWALSLKHGDIINDCSGFNVLIDTVEPDIYDTRRGGWFIYDVCFDTLPWGSCSLIHCGVEPALTVEEITRRKIEFYKYWPHKYGGWNFKTEKDPVWMRVSKGLPICDEQGLRHPDLIEEIQNVYESSFS